MELNQKTLPEPGEVVGLLIVNTTGMPLSVTGYVNEHNVAFMFSTTKTRFINVPDAYRVVGWFKMPDVSNDPAIEEPWDAIPY
jgi:hypothetical protein